MKRVLAGLLAFCMLFALTGCNGGPKLNDVGKRLIPDKDDQKAILETFSTWKSILSEEAPTDVSDETTAYLDSLKEAYEEHGKAAIDAMVGTDENGKTDNDALGIRLTALRVSMGLTTAYMGTSFDKPEKIQEGYEDFRLAVAELGNKLLENKDFFKKCPGFDGVYEELEEKEKNKKSESEESKDVAESTEEVTTTTTEAPTTTTTVAAEETTQRRKAIATDALNVRRDPSTNNERVGLLKKSESIIVIGEEAGFYKIEYKWTQGGESGDYAYVSKDYVEFVQFWD